GDSAGSRAEEKEARRIILQAAIDYLENSRAKSKPADAEVFQDLAHHYQRRFATLTEDSERKAGAAEPGFYKHFNRLSLELLHVERQTAVRLRNQRRISDELLRQIEHELDLGEAKLAAIA